MSLSEGLDGRQKDVMASNETSGNDDDVRNQLDDQPVFQKDIVLLNKDISQSDGNIQYGASRSFETEKDNIYEYENLPDVRKRNPTQKMVEFQLDNLEKKRSTLNRKINRKSATIEDMLYSYKNLEAVREQTHQMDDIFKLLGKVHQEYNALLPVDVQAKDEDWFDDIEHNMCAFKNKIHHWVKDAEAERKEMNSKKLVSKSGSKKSSHNSSSSKSSSSSRSSRESRALKERMKMAELIATAKYLERQQSLECETQRLKLATEVAKTKARVEVLEAPTTSDLLMPSNHTTTKTDMYNDEELLQLNPKQLFTEKQRKSRPYINHEENQFPDVKPIRNIRTTQNVNMKNKEENIASPVDTPSDVLFKLLQQQSAPDVDMEEFNGNPLNYHYFMALFKEVVEKKIDEPRGRLTRLIKYTTGEARDLIKHCMSI